MRFSKLIVTGKSASGKNYVFSELSKTLNKPLIKQTTRPIRSGEVEGVDYRFISESLFKERIDSNQYITYESFDIDSNTIWYYGISKEDFNESNLCILTPGEIKTLNESNLLIGSCVIFLDIERSILEQRLNLRSDLNDSITRRLDSDDKDFIDFKGYNMRYTNPNFKIGDLIESIS
jgi:guanylate kinase